MNSHYNSPKVLMGKTDKNKKDLTNKDVKNLKKAADDATFGMKNKNKSKQADK